MLAVAGEICGLHAQVLSSAELTVWARVEDFDRSFVREALWKNRSLVKCWAMRGTLHLLPSAELPLWHAALSTSGRYRRPAWWRRFGLTLGELDDLTEAVAAALDGRIMTREELVEEVGRLTGSASFRAKIAMNSWGTILKPAALTGRLCFGPSLGQRVRFTRPDTWLAASGNPLRPAADPEAAMTAVTRRFLSAYGPATFHDFGRWWGDSGNVSIARKWIGSLGDEVTPVDLDGEQAWMLSDHASEARELPPDRSVRLLPGFDHYVVAASRHAAHLLPGDFRARIYRPQGWISPVLLVGGRMEGVWRHEIRGSRSDGRIEPFRN